MAGEKRTATIGGKDVVLKTPASYAVRMEIWGLTTTSYTRAIGAAVGVCWYGPGKPRVQFAACGFAPAIYGGRVIDELVERGIATKEIVDAGKVALELIKGGLATEEQIAEAEGFTGPAAPEEGSTG